MNPFRGMTCASLGVALLLATTPGRVHADEPVAAPGQSEGISSYIRDYLSDPRRTGSLAGSVIGGAMLAHPAGPFVGSVIGFFVGKKSMFDEDKVRAAQDRAVYAKRDIIPTAGTGQDIPSLSFSNPLGITFDKPATAVAEKSPPQPLVAEPASVASGISRAQIAEQCAGKGRQDPRLRGLCFYYQGG